MRKKAKWFFWSVVFFSALAVYNSINDNLIGTTFSAYEEVLNPLGTQAKDGQKKIKKFIDKQLPILGTSSDSNGGEYQAPEFVFIEGKYYPYRSDNTYMINGRRIYYVDKGSQRYRAQKNDNKDRAPSLKHSEVDVSNPMAGFNPSKMAELMKSVKETKENMNKRNEYLKKMMEESQ